MTKCYLAPALAAVLAGLPTARAAPLEELVVTARRDTRSIDVANTLNIAPDVAQESIGGAIDARRDKGRFTDSERFSYSGKMAGNAQSVNAGYDLNGSLYAANTHHRVMLNGLFEHCEDADFPGGRIIPTRYERGSYRVG